MHLVRGDQGTRYAAHVAHVAHVARTMIMPHREGGQLRYATPPHPTRIDDTVAPSSERVSGRLGEP
ncbi:hypothetical protein ACGF8B_27780 [Streptomyces sp. NPDC047917]|uniref:hypothetical protein n=1 Tax=Streptomyces sp. NPDC047917 TaxID=3365491 RepID=UPI00371CC3B5